MTELSTDFVDNISINDYAWPLNLGQTLWLDNVELADGWPRHQEPCQAVPAAGDRIPAPGITSTDILGETGLLTPSS